MNLRTFKEPAPDEVESLSLTMAGMMTLEKSQDWDWDESG
jgi:hypothetical protein